jgi:hypothetical protein
LQAFTKPWVLSEPSLFGIAAGQLTFFEGKRIDDLVIDADYFIDYLRVGYRSIKLEPSE